MGMFGALQQTSLDKAKEAKFQQWRAALPANLQNMDDYDLRAAWLGNAKSATNGHLPDTYKLPNHFTFSTDSQYSTPQNPGGQWVDAGKNRWNFWASPANLAYHDAPSLIDYFNKYEPDATLILPSLGWSLPPGAPK